MSHDIRSPLSSIISVSNGDSGMATDESLKLVGSIAKYMLEFANCLLLSLQSEATGASIKMFHEYFNVYEMLQEIKVMMDPLAGQKQTSILVEGNKRDLMVTDKTKLIQIIMNFIGNSIKFTLNGKILLKFERTDKNLIKFTIEDTGAGMSEEAKKKMFVPFNTSGNKLFKNSEGVGLGRLFTPLLLSLNQAIG